jgi:putative transferase (TIGR04331 family)
MGRLLITTPLEETWDKKRELIFLGEWCKLFSQKKSWENLNYTTLTYHWDDRNKLYNDYKYLNNLYESLLVSLSLTLNKIHGVNFSNKYWRILIGPWLGIFIQVIYDRWEMIQKALDLEEELFSIITEKDISKHVPNDMSEFLDFICSDNWNQHIYESIILETNIIKQIKGQSSYNKKNEKSKINIRKKSLKSFIKSFINFFGKFLTPSNSPLVLSSYLSKKNELKMGLTNKYFPLWNNNIKPNIYTFSGLKRDFKINYITKNLFEKFILKAIIKQIPKAYLEGFERLRMKAENLGWQKNPKYIFTSNNYWADDLFKCYSAMQSLNNVPLFTGQHGGHYGTGKFSFIEDHQLSISDKFISWGWTNKKYNHKIAPIGNLKYIKPKKKRNANNKKLLIITCSLPRYSYHLYSILISSQWINYFEDQCEFVDSLNEKIKSITTVRLSSEDYGWDQLLRWKKKFPNLNYDLNKELLINQLNKTKLVVSTYNATTFLESMSMNIPTVIFWNPNHWELREDAIPFYEELEKVKIFHKNPVSAASHINLVYDELEIWWNSDQVQSVKTLFLHRYCRNEDRLIKKLNEEFIKYSDCKNSLPKPLTNHYNSFEDEK